MECPRCKSDVPEVSHFCHHCGAGLRSGDAGRRKAYAAKPDEPVASFRLVSTIMPYGTGRRPSTYRIALGIALAITLVAAALGALPVALMVAAFAVPIVYILYLYDVKPDAGADTDVVAVYSQTWSGDLATQNGSVKLVGFDAVIEHKEGITTVVRFYGDAKKIDTLKPELKTMFNSVLDSQ